MPTAWIACSGLRRLPGLAVEAMFCATWTEPGTSIHVGSAATNAATPPAASSAAAPRALWRLARSSPASTSASTAVAASAHTANPTPSAEIPAAASSANGSAPRAGPVSQRRCSTTSAPRARIIGSAVISLTEPSSS